MPEYTKEERKQILKALKAAAPGTPQQEASGAHVSNAPIGFTPHEKSAWSVGYEEGFRAAATAPAGGVTEAQRGEIAYQLTKRIVIDLPTARAAVDAALTTAARAAELDQGAESRQSRYRAALEEIAAMEYDRWSNGARAKEIAQRILDAGVTPTAAEVVDYCARHGVSPAKAKEALTTAARAAEPEAYRVFKDGNQWCAVGPAFTNLQESPAGFADTPYLALERLTEAEAEERRKVWRAASPTPPTGTSKEGGEAA